MTERRVRFCNHRGGLAVALLATALAACSVQPGPTPLSAVPDPVSTLAVIVQGPSAEAARAAVEAAGGTVTHELAIIRAVGASLTAVQRAALAEDSRLRLYDDRRVEVQKKTRRPRTSSGTRDGTAKTATAPAGRKRKGADDDGA